ncbi:MAG: hypothetical protein M1818_005730 [Claussenomyces sp. TS43310]|nr:MAG: hypothetical protein M1818_005730 [Claussenomyces sp. TS43310]
MDSYEIEGTADIPVDATVGDINSEIINTTIDMSHQDVNGVDPNVVGSHMSTSAPEAPGAEDEEVEDDEDEDDPWGLGKTGMDLEAYAKREYTRSAAERPSEDLLQDKIPRMLRQSFRRKTFRGTGWQDQDETGNYHPEARLKVPTSRLRTHKLGAGPDRRVGKHRILKINIGTFDKIRDLLAGYNIEDEAKVKRRGYHVSDELSDYEIDLGHARSVLPKTRPRKRNQKATRPSKEREKLKIDSRARHRPKKNLTANSRKSDQTSRKRSRPHRKLRNGFTGGTVKIIRSCYCHPIKFNYDSPSHPSSPSKNLGSVPSACHFCASPPSGRTDNGTRNNQSGLFYSIFGLGERRVEVVQWDSGLGNEELEGGWSEAGSETSRMCRACTTKRIVTACCEEHEIRRIEGVDERNYDHDGAFIKMLAENGIDMRPYLDETGSMGPPQHIEPAPIEARWCSICLSSAYYECCAPQKFAIQDLRSSGCGLLLCDVCAQRLIGCKPPLPPLASATMRAIGPLPFPQPQINSNLSFRATQSLDTLVRAARRDVIDYREGLRADAEFLTREGELMRRWLSDFGEDATVDETPD